MKVPPLVKSGFTLVEMTVVIVFGLALSSAGMLLLNQQISTIRIFNEQDFILKEAPRINSSLTALLGRADAIRLHGSFSDAIQDQDPVLQDATTLVAAFRDVDGSISFGIICFETVGGEERLNYYYFDPTQTPPSQGTPSWTISRNIDGADFDLVDGLFRATLTGPSAEQITYTVSPNQ
jgi:hypothetical protein